MDFFATISIHLVNVNGRVKLGEERIDFDISIAYSCPNLAQKLNIMFTQTRSRQAGNTDTGSQHHLRISCFTIGLIKHFCNNENAGGKYFFDQITFKSGTKLLFEAGNFCTVSTLETYFQLLITSQFLFLSSTSPVMNYMIFLSTGSILQQGAIIIG